MAETRKPCIRLPCELPLQIAENLDLHSLHCFLKAFPALAGLLSFEHFRITDEEGYTILHTFVANCDHALLSTALSCANAFLNFRDNNGFTPLHLAARVGDMRAVRLIIERNRADMRNTSVVGSGLRLTVIIGNERLGSEALSPREKQAQDVAKWAGRSTLNVPDLCERYPLHLAAMHGQTGIIRLLQQEDDLQVNLQDGLGRLPITSAVYEGHTSTVQALLERADFDLPSPSNDLGLLVDAILYNSDAAIVKILVDSWRSKGLGADDLVQLSSTLSDLAIEGYGKVVRLLLEIPGIHVDRTNCPWMASIAADMKNHEDKVRALEIGADRDIGIRD